MVCRSYQFAICAALFATTLAAQTSGPDPGPDDVVVVINDSSQLSRQIAEYYVAKRDIPLENRCHIQAPLTEEIAREVYETRIAKPIADCLRKSGMVEQALYLVTTAGLPLRVAGSDGIEGDIAAVDSELALLYSDIKTGKPHPAKGTVRNPFFGKRSAKFSHPEFPIYLVARLAAYDLEGVRAMIDQSLRAQDQGKVVVDMKEDNDDEGNNWLRDTMLQLPRGRVIFDSTTTVLYKQQGVIGYASWGSNDKSRRERFVGFQWLPGSIATEFVSTNGRTFEEPPEDWNISDWGISSIPKWFAGSPQSLTADYLKEGATAATGHVYEPFLQATPRPDYLFPAYLSGRTLAESYYLSIPYLSWQNIIAGDPLMRLKK